MRSNVRNEARREKESKRLELTPRTWMEWVPSMERSVLHLEDFHRQQQHVASQQRMRLYCPLIRLYWERKTNNLLIIAVVLYAPLCSLDSCPLRLSWEAHDARI
jgi:hypothetical protein